MQITAVSKLLKPKTTFNTENYRHVNVAHPQKSSVTEQAFKRCTQNLQYKYPARDLFFPVFQLSQGKDRLCFQEATCVLLRPPSRRIFVICRECWGLQQS